MDKDHNSNVFWKCIPHGDIYHRRLLCLSICVGYVVVSMAYMNLVLVLTSISGVIFRSFLERSK